MLTIRIISTGEVKEVTQNIAFDLIDKGLAKIYKKESLKESIKEVPKKEFKYRNRQVRSRVTK